MSDEIQTTEGAASAPKRNMLTGKQRFLVQTALRKMDAEIQAARMSVKMVLPILQAQFDFPVTIWNVKDAAEIAEVKLHLRQLNRAKRADVLALREEVARLRNLVGGMRGELDDAKGLIATVLDALTEPGDKRPAGVKVKYRLQNGVPVKESIPTAK